MWPFQRQHRYQKLTSSTRSSRCTPGFLPSWLLVFTLLYMTLALALYRTSRRDPTSWFFSPEEGFKPRYSAIRREQADRYIHSVAVGDIETEKFNPKKRDEAVCVGIVTFARKDARYFRSTVGSLLRGLSPSDREKIFFTTLIAHSDPHIHPAYSETWLHEVSDEVLTYNVSQQEFEHIKQMENERGLFYEKGLYDYTYLLKFCHAQNTPFIAIFEDDIIAMDGWIKRTKDAISKVVEQSTTKKENNFLYLRLFYTEKFLGWNKEAWPKYLTVSAFIFAFVTSILYTVRSLSPVTRLYLTHFTILILCGACLPLIILLFFAAGRMTVLPLPNGVNEMNNFGCCSQGFVFSHDMAQKLIDWYQVKKVGFVDMLTEEFGDLTGYSRWAMTPSVIQHVGSRSSKDADGDEDENGRSVAGKIWNFEFESFDSRKLKEERVGISRLRNDPLN